MKIKHNPPNPDLTALLEAAKSHKMTPEEADAQRRSWIRGNIGLSYPEMTAEQLDGLLRLALGPSLSEQLATARTEARKAALEEAARLVETQQEAIRETDEGTERYTSPRWEGNRAGLAFATAIRARIGTDPTTDRGEG